jgi:hypothetical protein
VARLEIGRARVPRSGTDRAALAAGPVVALAILYGTVVLANLLFHLLRYVTSRIFWRVRYRHRRFVRLRRADPAARAGGAAGS